MELLQTQLFRAAADFNKAESEKQLERTEATAVAISIDDWAEKRGVYSQKAKEVAKLKCCDAEDDLNYYLDWFEKTMEEDRTEKDEFCDILRCNLAGKNLRYLPEAE